MPEQDVLAAQRALYALTNTTARFAGIPTGASRVSARLDSVLCRNPRSKGKLHWASDSGRYRELWLADRTDATERLFHVYFGRWGRTARRSAYVVVFRHRSPQLEVRLSPARVPKENSVSIVHDLVFRGRRYEDPAKLRNRALALARRGGVPVENRKAVLGAFDTESGRLRPGRREVLRRIVTCALIKRSLVESALRESDSQVNPSSGEMLFVRKRERFPRGQWARIDLLLDKRFQAHGRHNRLIYQIAERLEAQGYRVRRLEPFDLLIRGKGRSVIVEVKAWRTAEIVGALRAATGQLLYYSHLFTQENRRTPSLIAAVPQAPSRDLITFVERTAKMGLVWSTRNGRFSGGHLARSILPELVEGR